MNGECNYIIGTVPIVLTCGRDTLLDTDKCSRHAPIHKKCIRCGSYIQEGKVMGLIVSIYRDTYDAATIFRGHKDITVVNVEGPFEPTPDRPAAMLVSGPGGTTIIVPIDDDGVPIPNVAFGGSFGASSDSRFREKVPFYGAVAIHDYDLSREYGWGKS